MMMSRDLWRPWVNLNFMYKRCKNFPAASHKSPHLPLVIVHGLFGNCKNFLRFSEDFKGDRDIYLVDLRNHGMSEWHQDMSLDYLRNDLVSFLDRVGLEKCDIFGFSLGGRTTMTACTLKSNPRVPLLPFDAEKRFRKIIIGDISPVDYENKWHIPTSIAAMINLDLEKGRIIRKSEDGEVIIKGSRRILDKEIAPYVEDPITREFLLQNLAWNNNTKTFEWRIDLLTFQKNIDNISRFPGVIPSGDGYNLKTEMLKECKNEVLFIKGGNSVLMQEKHEPVIARLFPNSKIVTLENTSHDIYHANPQLFFSVVSEFLDEKPQKE